MSSMSFAMLAMAIAMQPTALTALPKSMVLIDGANRHSPSQHAPETNMLPPTEDDGTMV